MKQRPSIKEIIATFRAIGGNKTQTARALNISRSTVQRWIKRCHSFSSIVKWKGVKRCSTRSKTIYCALTYEQQLTIVKLREAKGYTAAKIKQILRS